MEKIGIDFSDNGDRGAIAVMRNGAHYVLTLPEGYDSRTRVKNLDGRILVTHPDYIVCEIIDEKLVPVFPIRD